MYYNGTDQTKLYFFTITLLRRYDTILNLLSVSQVLEIHTYTPPHIFTTKMLISPIVKFIEIRISFADDIEMKIIKTNTQ